MDGCCRNCMSTTRTILAQQGPGKNSILWTRKGMALVSLWKLVPSKPLVFHCLPLSSSETLKFWLPNHLSFALLCFNMSCLHIDFARFCLKGKWHHLQSRWLHCEALWRADYGSQDGGPMRLPRKRTQGCNPLPIPCKMFQGK